MNWSNEDCFRKFAAATAHVFYTRGRKYESTIIRERLEETARQEQVLKDIEKAGQAQANLAHEQQKNEDSEKAWAWPNPRADLLDSILAEMEFKKNVKKSKNEWKINP